MGSVCCVSARDGTASEGANGEILRRSIQYSPSWGVRWDNRGRVAGEEAPAAVMVDRVRQRLENKSEPFFEPLPEVALAEENIESNLQKSPPPNENVGAPSEAPGSEPPEARSISTEVMEIMELPAARDSTMSPDVTMPSSSYLSTSPLPPRIHLAPASSTPSKWSPRIPRSLLLRQGSDSQLTLPKSPSNYSASEGRSSPLLPVSSIESARGSHGGSVDGWSVQSFPESTTAMHRATWSFESDSLGSHRYKLGQSRSSRKSDSQSNELKSCVVCSKYLVEKSSFSSQKIVPNNELSVVAVLVCGHVYHADCLDRLTPEISKYDPSCPVCTFGEPHAVRMFEKLLKAEMDMKSKKRRNRIVNSAFIPLARGSSPRLESSPSLRSSFARPFLKRHFSFGAKASSSTPDPDTLPVRKRSLLWSKSSK
uniref:RING-type domain-containing protein n=1 Tax=Kalanchoe fedtschenkoi TaxID=63787 RepID=A0A7N0ZSV7_KALFE